MENLPLEHAKELFDAYILILGQDVRGSQQAAEIEEECMSIAEKLLDLGFRIYTTAPVPKVERITHPNGNEQTLIIHTYDVALFKDENILDNPLFQKLGAQTKIFGTCMMPIHKEPVHPPISKEQEVWFEQAIGALLGDKENK